MAAIMKEAESVNRYPDGGCFYLRQELVKELGVKPDQLIFGNGSDELIIMAIRAFIEPGDEVVLSHPSFAVYAIGAQVAGAKLKVVAMKDFRHDLEAMAKAVTPKTKMIFIDNPGNPSGGYVNADALLGFLKKLPKTVMVFLDEAYCDYARGTKDYPNSLPWLPQFENLIIARTFSKMYGLAGLRVGYAVGGTEIIGVLNCVREPFNVNSLAQAAAVAALKDRSYYDRALSLLQEQREFLYKEITALGLSYVPSVTNFILIDTGRNGKEVMQALLRQGVIVRDMGAWGLEQFIRVTIGLETENKALIKALKRQLPGFCKAKSARRAEPD